MDKIIEYERFNINDYIGQPVVQDIPFRNQLGQTFQLTIYDNGTYCIIHPGKHEYKHADELSMEANDEKFFEIDPRFKDWLKYQLGQYHQM